MRLGLRGAMQLRLWSCLTVTAVVIAGTVAGCGSSAESAPSATAPIAAETQTTPTATPPSPTAAVPQPATATEWTPGETAAIPTEIEAEASAEPAFTAEDLQTFVADLVAGSGGFAEVVVALPDGEFVVDINGGEPMEAASLYKLGIMIEVFVQRETGVLTFDDGVVLEQGYFHEGEDVYGFGEIGSVVDVRSLLYAMITQSSNVAATALLSTVGNENINATLASLGVSNTEIRWMPDPYAEPAADSEEMSDDGTGEDAEPNDSSDTSTDEAPVEDDGESVDETVPDENETVDGGEPSGSAGQVVLLSASTTSRSSGSNSHSDSRADEALNVTTAEDVAYLYTLLLRGEVMAPSVSQEMLDLLALQEINDRIPAYLPGGTVVAHKTGNLDGLVHDAGVIYAPAGPIIVVVLTEDMDEAVATDLIAQIALAAYDAAS